MSASFAPAREFVYRSARVLERRLFARLFEDGEAEGVVKALVGYTNADGGFGHGLEPDKLAPESQPLDVQFALQTLAAAGAHDVELARRACEFLATVADERGLVPIILPSALRYPRASHWESVELDTGVNPAAAIAGHLYELGIEHPWLERVTSTVFEEVERAPLDEAHAIAAALVFAQHAPGGERLMPLLREALPRARWFRADSADETYGLPPTAFPRDWFGDSVYGAHLDRLEDEQEDDGGWPVSWEPPGPGSMCAWRGIVTIEALRKLVDNGRLER
jgi:hypothetical protein